MSQEPRHMKEADRILAATIKRNAPPPFPKIPVNRSFQLFIVTSSNGHWGGSQMLQNTVVEFSTTESADIAYNNIMADRDSMNVQLSVTKLY